MKSDNSQRMICHNPFEWFEIHPGGQVFACCPAWLKRPLGNFLTDGLDEIWNGKTARELRRSIHDGSFRHCNRRRCPRLINGTAPVGKFNELETGPVRDVFEAGQEKLPWGPQKLNLCYDLSCNLACSSCRSEVYVANEEDRRRTEFFSDRVQRELAPWARQLIISGTGDPFASPAYRRLLEEFVPCDYPQLESIHLHSNGLLWNAASWQSMQAAQPFVRTAEISIDAASATTYNVNRGGDFEQLLKNLTFLAGLPIAITLSFVVQQNNYHEMINFVSLAQDFGFAVYFSQLVNWGTFSREEFKRRAVHQPDHPEYPKFCTMLREVVKQERVDVGNLRSVLSFQGK